MHRVLFITAADDPLTSKISEVAGQRSDLKVIGGGELPNSLADFDAVVVGDCRLESPLNFPTDGGPRFVQLTRGNHRDIDAAALAADGIVVAGASPVLAPWVSEHALGLGTTAATNDGLWGMVSREAITGLVSQQRDLFYGKTIGIVGFGRVGGAIAEADVLQDSTVIYADVRTIAPAKSPKRVVRRSTLDLLMSQSDFVFMNVQWGPTSNPLIDERELRLMKSGSVLVNTADARLIDSMALSTALESGRIRAGFDIEEPEASQFGSLANAVVTPYLAARCDEADAAVAEFVADNIDAALASDDTAVVRGIVEVVGFPRSGDPAFWSSKMSARTEE